MEYERPILVILCLVNDGPITPESRLPRRGGLHHAQTISSDANPILHGKVSPVESIQWRIPDYVP